MEMATVWMEWTAKFKCSCDPGFTGEICYTNIDECVGVNCFTGVWMALTASAVTVVLATQKHCVRLTLHDDCVRVNCNGNGECLGGMNSFICECSPGYTGSLCDMFIYSYVKASRSRHACTIAKCQRMAYIIITLTLLSHLSESTNLLSYSTSEIFSEQ